MPKPATMLGMLFVLLAMIAYSIGVWGGFRRKGYNARDLVFLGVGVVFDIAATAAMSSTIGWTLDLRPGLPLVHTVIALVAMFGMIAVTVAGVVAFRGKKNALMATLTRWAVAPWAAWAFMFLWGGSRVGLK